MSEVAASTQKPGPSGFVGVYWQSPKNRTPRWIAQVCVNGKIKAVPGRFGTAEEAHHARLAFIAAHGIGTPVKTTAGGAAC
jgi:hypothetical protein